MAATQPNSNVNVETPHVLQNESASMVVVQDPRSLAEVHNPTRSILSEAAEALRGDEGILSDEALLRLTMSNTSGLHDAEFLDSKNSRVKRPMNLSLIHI